MVIAILGNGDDIKRLLTRHNLQSKATVISNDSSSVFWLSELRYFTNCVNNRICSGCIALLYARIMVSSILNLVAALTACGMFAGSVIVSPCFTL